MVVENYVSPKFRYYISLVNTAIMTLVATAKSRSRRRPSRRRCSFGRQKWTCSRQAAISWIRRDAVGLGRCRTSQCVLIRPTSSTSRRQFWSKRPSLKTAEQNLSRCRRICSAREFGAGACNSPVWRNCNFVNIGRRTESLGN